MNTSYTYLIYQAERTMSTSERRAADRQAGELAKSLASLWHPAIALTARRRECRHSPAAPALTVWREILRVVPRWLAARPTAP